jgi:hypothetical protein
VFYEEEDMLAAKYIVRVSVILVQIGANSGDNRQSPGVGYRESPLAKEMAPTISLPIGRLSTEGKWLIPVSKALPSLQPLHYAES